jgi:hypothetical protein
MDSQNDGPSPLDEAGWTALSAPKPSAAFTHSLREQSSHLVRRRAQWRRWRAAGGLALAYVVGIASALAWSRGTPNAPLVEQQANQSAKPKPPVEQPRVEIAALAPDQLRSRVPGAPRAEQIKLLRLAGDRYFYESTDLRAALDCYRQVVELTPEESLRRLDPQDNWLLAELKRSAAKTAANHE